MIRVRVPGKIIYLGEHAVQWGGTALATGVDLYTTVEATYDSRLGGELVVVGRHARLFREVAEGLQACQAIPGGDPLRPGGALSYAVRVVEEVPEGVGLGSSSALVVAFVATLSALHRGPQGYSPRALYWCASQLEWWASGASGVDVAACVFGSVRYSLAQGPLPSPVAPEASIVYTGRRHTAPCRIEMTPDQLGRLEALVPPPWPARGAFAGVAAGMPAAHAILVEMGLGFPEARQVVALVPRAKITGRGGGGCLLCVPPLTPAEAAALEEAGFRSHLARPRGGARVEDTRYRALPAALAAAPLTPPHLGARGSGRAASNIALIKYWGKTARQMPLNPSASLPLPHCCTVTELEVAAGPPGPGEEAPPRVRALLAEAAGAVLPPGLRIVHRTRSNFPHSCGAASSAAGFASLARALADLLKVPPEWAPYWIEQWARLGSGSAVRSTQDQGLVVWEGSHARQLLVPEEMTRLDHVLVVHDPFPKECSSSQGHELAPTSPFLALRVAAAEGRLLALISAFMRGDLGGVGRISEEDAVGLHSVMATSTPPLAYLTAAAREFIAQFVRFRDAHGVAAFFTVDAGPNVHLLSHPSATPGVLALACGCKSAYVLYRGRATPWYRAHVVSGKRFAGKTTLCARWAAEMGDAVQVVNLSDAIKRDYWERHLAAEVTFEAFATREGREPHRAAMVRYARDLIARHGKYYWPRRLWEGLPPAPRVIIVGDARRPADLEFFGACTDCTTYRVTCPDETRAARGWVRNEVDGTDSETGLDGATFDHVIPGDRDAPSFELFNTRPR